ncbi:MAG TPA: hypothetical protein VFF69_00475 [Phycisphaerales bacterium]|nr:hypothetical protein [Phycisphaerales bacterium]
MTVGQGVLPPAVVLPLACLAVLVIAAHLAALGGATAMPLSRRRIRTASGVVMLITSAVLAYSFAYAPVSDPRRFTMAWSASVMLLAVVLGLGGLDAINNVRLARLQGGRLRRAAGSLERRIVDSIAAGPRPGKAGPGSDDEPRLTLRGDDHRPDA